MRIKAYNLIFLALFVVLIGPEARADSEQSREYQVKAAFLYNFIMFVDGLEGKMADSNEPIVLGIIGKDPFSDAFEPIKDKLVMERRVVIKRFKGLEELKNSGEKDKFKLQQEIEAIRKCHLLFICQSEKEVLRETINLVKDYSVLTVGDTNSFLEAGGIINFLIEEKKVCFEVNVTAAKQAKLQIRSQLLRLAKRVVEEKTSDEKEN